MFEVGVQPAAATAQGEERVNDAVARHIDKSTLALAKDVRPFEIEPAQVGWHCRNEIATVLLAIGRQVGLPEPILATAAQIVSTATPSRW